MDSRIIAELIVHLGRIASGDGLVEGLTPGQWSVLRYFARANRFSRTPSAFAAFHSTTRGTVSQAIKSLVTQGYLRQTRSETRAIIEKDPLEALARAAAALPPGVRGQFSNGLQRMLDHVASETGTPPFGTCKTCAHFEGDGCCQEGLATYACGFLNSQLIEEELDELCINFSTGKAAPLRTPGVGIV